MKYFKNNFTRILGILIILSIIAGIIYGGIKYIPKINSCIYNKYKECQKYRNYAILNVYEIYYGNEIYLITSANYSEDTKFNNITLMFYPNNGNDSQYIIFPINGKPFKIKMIKTFKSKEDTTSFIKIK